MKALAQVLAPDRWLLYSKKGGRRYDKIEYQAGDVLIFGSESKGLSDEILEQKARAVYLPISPNVRSLNLSSVIHIASYEAFRQHDFPFSS